MGRLCVFDSCSTNSCLIKPRDIQLHRFPSDPVTKTKWIEWVRSVGGTEFKDFVPTKSSHTVCSRHFKQLDYIRKRLCYQAIPSVPPQSSMEISGQCAMGKITNVHSLSVPRLQGTADQMDPLFCGYSHSSSFDVTSSTKNNWEEAEMDNDGGSQRLKRKFNGGDMSLSDFECYEKTANSLEMTSNDMTKAKLKLQKVQLKYVRALKKIKTLTDLINQFKEDKNPIDQEVAQIKVCSNCRNINVCE